MSLHPSSAAQQGKPKMPANRVSQIRANRTTMWPSPFHPEHDPDVPSWPGHHHQRASQRWTSTFDSEARATRMSYYVADTLLPSAAPSRAPNQWPTTQGGGGAFVDRRSRYQRHTWMRNALNGQDDDTVPIWEGNFDVEKRQSFANRTSSNASSWYRDSMMSSRDDEKFAVPKARDPLSAEQLKKADPVGGLASVDVLLYPFPGEGTVEEPYMVSWLENDPANPLNFSKGKKWLNALILALAVWTVSIASSGFSQGRWPALHSPVECFL